MKKNYINCSLLLLAAFLMSSFTFPNNQIPQAVKDAFTNLYPQVDNVKWEREYNGLYEGEFTVDGKEMSAEFMPDGTWMGTETEISLSELPAIIKKAVAKEFPGFVIDEAESIIMPDGTTNYGVDIEKGKESVEAVYTSSGAVYSMVKNFDEKDY